MSIEQAASSSSIRSGHSTTSGATIRDAQEEDLPRLVELYAMLASDPEQEDPSLPLGAAYVQAFRDIDADPRQRLLVLEADRELVATLVLMINPNVSHHGRSYAIVENVVVDEAVRGRGYGAELMQYAISQANAADCYKLSLTSAERRAGAHRFYERLGFSATHKGYRLDL